ncbi:MAG: HEPN domain-containing protein [bacterium]
MRVDSESYEDWFLKARNNLRAAEAILRYYEEDPPTDTACYHCHQVAEKSLKGYLLYKDEVPPWSHDLIELLNRCIMHDSTLEVLREDIEVLNKYYIEAKYPADIPIIYPKEEACEAKEKAVGVLRKVEEIRGDRGDLRCD